MGSATKARKTSKSEVADHARTHSTNHEGQPFVTGEQAWGWNAERQTWRKCVIVAVGQPSIPDIRRDGRQESQGEIYVHWKGFDRRLDQWIPVAHLRGLHDEPTGHVVTEDVESDHEHAGVDAAYLKEHIEHTKFKTINRLAMGNYLVDCWYFSPYPLEVQNAATLFVCAFCLGFFKFEEEYRRHESRCTARHPPGNEIYRDSDRRLAMWELDGGIARHYCENLCFISKLFLDHKTLRHPVHLFLFYLLTEMHDDGYHVVGYFSKEKYSRNNVSCICTLPQYQKKGYGKYLINFSYALTIMEGRRGTPERPLSDLGKASYLNFWRQTLLEILPQRESTTLNQLADQLGFEPSDIVTCLEDCDLLCREQSSGAPFIYLTPEVLEVLANALGKPPPPIKPEGLHWLPYDPFLGPFEYSADVN